MISSTLLASGATPTLAALTVLAAARSALVWFHPTIGYGTGVLEGADLRGDVIAIVWLSWSGVRDRLDGAAARAAARPRAVALGVFDKLY